MGFESRLPARCRTSAWFNLAARSCASVQTPTINYHTLVERAPEASRADILEVDLSLNPRPDCHPSDVRPASRSKEIFRLHGFFFSPAQLLIFSLNPSTRPVYLSFGLPAADNLRGAQCPSFATFSAARVELESEQLLRLPG